MLPRKKLLPLKSEFKRIRTSGKVYDSPSFGMIVAYSGQKTANSGAKVAFVVSKKIDRRSVVRHEVKRKLSEACVSFLPRVASSVELVFLAKSKAVTSSVSELEKEMDSVLKRARLL